MPRLVVVGNGMAGIRAIEEVLARGGGDTYDKLILATGSRSFFPPMAGLWADDKTLADGVFGFRTLDDTATMIAEAANRTKAVVIGGGLLGLEAARGLQNRGLTVDVVHAGPTLMNAQLDELAGAILRRSVESLGIGVHTEKRTSEVIVDDGTNGRLKGIRFSDGERLECDMLVIAAGIRPNVGLAQRAGLTVERAIVTDDHMRSIDDDDVYVVGECAQHRGQVYGLVAPLWEQAKVLADHLTGTDPAAAYHGSRVATKLKVAGVDVASMGIKAPERPDDEFVQYSEPRHGVYKTVVIRDGKLVGATLVGDVSKVSFLTQAFDTGLPLPDERVSLMFDIGTPDVAVGVAELADDAQVCNCNGVSKGALVACVRDGTTSVTGVMAKTKAGKGCGSCKELVGQVVAWAADGAVTEDPSASWYVPGVPYDKPTLMGLIRDLQLHSVSSVFAALALDGREDAGSKMALASLLEMMWADEFVDERDARFINDRVHANIQRDGTFSVVPQMKGGVTNAAQLRRIADVAEKYEVPMIKLTGGQRIDLLGIRKEDLPSVWADLDMPSGYAYGKSFRTVKTCVGSDFCRYGVGDSTALGIALEERYQGLASPAKMKLAVTGCPRNCAEALCKDLGVVAVDGGRWEIYVGGAAGAHIRKGDLLATVDSAAEVMMLTGRFLQYYRENANWLERTYAFVPRVGIEKVRAVILDDAEGIAARLDANMAKSVAAYRDPWLDGRAPVTEGQFRTSLPLLPLPQVPVR
jgi:nitrite reductase (NADH) large subunit